MTLATHDTHSIVPCDTKANISRGAKWVTDSFKLCGGGDDIREHTLIGCIHDTEKLFVRQVAAQ